VAVTCNVLTPYRIVMVLAAILTAKRLHGVVRPFRKSAMSKTISYAVAADLVEAYAAGAEGSLKSALMVLVAGLRWKQKYDGDDEEPALISDAYALVFPMHKRCFRDLADVLRSMSTS
jgi:hypothetical protein